MARPGGLDPDDVRIFGEQAERISRDTAFDEIIRRTTDRLQDSWRLAKTVEEREELHAKLLGVEEVQKTVEVAVQRWKKQRDKKD